MSNRFDNVVDKINFPNEESKTLEYWNEIDAFKTSMKLSEGKPEYTFYDGPPFATGIYSSFYALLLYYYIIINNMIIRIASLWSFIGWYY